MTTTLTKQNRFDLLRATGHAVRDVNDISSVPTKVELAVERILAEHLAPAEAAAWDAGATKASCYGGAYLRSILLHNPHRPPVESGVAEACS